MLVELEIGKVLPLLFELTLTLSVGEV